MALRRIWGLAKETSNPPADPDAEKLRFRSKDDRRARSLFWTVNLACLALLAWRIVLQRSYLGGRIGILAAWLGLEIIASVLPVKGWDATPLSPDFPVVTAGAVLLSPIEVALVAFLGTFEAREFRRQVPFGKALFNHSQSAISFYVASVLVHGLAPSPASSPLLVPLCLLALVVDLIVNYALTGLALAEQSGRSFGYVVRRLKVGTWSDFLLTCAAWGCLSAMLIALYDRMGLWALVAFVPPTLLGRQILARSQMYVDAQEALLTREEALMEVARQIQLERKDERRLIAADLHDEVLQPMFKASLMARVLQADLSTGRLFELEADLPEMGDAIRQAMEELRCMIADLHQSALGRGGLAESLRRLIRETSGRSHTQVHSSVEEVKVDEASELALYQIGKEALANALNHAKSRNIWIELLRRREGVVLQVRDDGEGFDPYVDRPNHFGIHIMKERARTIGAQLYLDSYPGAGTTLTVVL